MQRKQHTPRAARPLAEKKKRWLLAGAAALFFMLCTAGCGAALPEERAEEENVPAEADRESLSGLREQTGRTQAGGERQSFPVLEALDGERVQEAKRITARCCVRLDVAGEEAEYYGSGVVWDQRDGRLILATAGHLLREGEVLRVVFYDGTAVSGRTIGISSSFDVGFVEAEWAETPSEAGTGTETPAEAGAETETPALVSLHQRRFDTLDAYSPLFVMASAPDGCADLILDASLQERAWYREEFGSDVMILSGSAQQGASGAGVFDGCGSFVGLLLGGAEEQIAVLSMEQVNQAGAEVYGSLRETEDYGR